MLEVAGGIILACLVLFVLGVIGLLIFGKQGVDY